MAVESFKHDLHVHTTRYSACSEMLPEEALNAAKAAGPDGLVITEHGKTGLVSSRG